MTLRPAVAYRSLQRRRTNGRSQPGAGRIASAYGARRARGVPQPDRSGGRSTWRVGACSRAPQRGRSETSDTQDHSGSDSFFRRVPAERECVPRTNAIRCPGEAGCWMPASLDATQLQVRQARQA